MNIPLDAVQSKDNLDGLIKHIYGQVSTQILCMQTLYCACRTLLYTTLQHITLSFYKKCCHNVHISLMLSCTHSDAHALIMFAVCVVQLQVVCVSSDGSTLTVACMRMYVSLCVMLLCLQVFSWLVGKINSSHQFFNNKNAEANSVAFIGILDIFGFEIMNRNRLVVLIT
jgi:hypothetical protein